MPTTTEDAVNLQLVPTYPTASTVPAMLDTPVTDLPAKVTDRYSFCQLRVPFTNFVTRPI